MMLPYEPSKVKNRRLSFLTGILILFTGCAEEEKHITPENDVTVTVLARIPGCHKALHCALLEGRMKAISKHSTS